MARDGIHGLMKPPFTSTSSAYYVEMTDAELMEAATAAGTFSFLEVQDEDAYSDIEERRPAFASAIAWGMEPWRRLAVIAIVSAPLLHRRIYDFIA